MCMAWPLHCLPLPHRHPSLYSNAWLQGRTALDLAELYGQSDAAQVLRPYAKPAKWAFLSWGY